MELDPKLRSRVWWKGALESAAKGIPTGIAVSIVAAALLAFVAFPLLPGLAPIMGSFLTFPGAPAFLPMIPAVGPFFPIPILFFNTALTIAANAVTGGDLEVAKLQQEVDHAQNVQRLDALEGREQMVEQVVGQQSSMLRSILSRGRRNKSFAAAEEARATAPTTKTIQ